MNVTSLLCAVSKAAQQRMGTLSLIDDTCTDSTGTTWSLNLQRKPTTPEILLRARYVESGPLVQRPAIVMYRLQEMKQRVVIVTFRMMLMTTLTY
ncbi:hypothetical protein MTO96_037580 [Rhipicephalus appendiculatus]